MTSSISILVVDRHALIRDVLSKQLACEPDITVVGAVGNAARAVTEAERLKPDLVLMDIDMPGLSCFVAASDMQAKCPEIRVAFLGDLVSDRCVEQALKAHAAGYLTKSEGLETVIAAIRTIAGGGTYYSPEVERRIVGDGNSTGLASAQKSRTSVLTPRELEVLCYLARGMSRKEIAQTVHISSRTVHTHANKLMAKLDIHDRVELARFAIREGLAEA